MRNFEFKHEMKHAVQRRATVGALDPNISPRRSIGLITAEKPIPPPLSWHGSSAEEGTGEGKREGDADGSDKRLRVCQC